MAFIINPVAPPIANETPSPCIAGTKHNATPPSSIYGSVAI